MHDDAALVIGRSPTDEAPFAFDRLERRRVPFFVRSRGLNVVMGIEQDGRCAFRGGDLPVDGGVGTFDFEEADVAEPRRLEKRRDLLGRASDLFRVEARGGHGRDADEFFEFGASLREAVSDCGCEVGIHVDKYQGRGAE